MCIYKYTHTYIHTCMHTYIHTCIHYTYTHRYMHMHVDIQMSTVYPGACTRGAWPRCSCGISSHSSWVLSSRPHILHHRDLSHGVLLEDSIFASISVHQEAIVTLTEPQHTSWLIWFVYVFGGVGLNSKKQSVLCVTRAMPDSCTTYSPAFNCLLLRVPDREVG